MYKPLLFVMLSCFCLASAGRSQESEFLKKFMRDYAILDQDLLNHPGEHAEIKDFVYKKDLATFTFEEGDIFLLRYVDDRPTTAIFSGKGNCTMEMPTHVERQSLWGVSHDSTVNEDFEVCFIRMSDDFDRRLKEKFTFETRELKWKEFNVAKQAQGEVFFKASIYHDYDNYFQLLRSHHERDEDGYFWVDFNRYVFSYDPNRPEEVLLAYEYEGGDIYVTHAARYQRDETGIYADSMMSHIDYPTTMLNRRASITMGGLDGRNMEACDATVNVLVNDDSLRFVSLFLHYNLKEDSIYYDGQPIDYYRRKDFNFIGIILPEYRYRGDTLTFQLWYEGKNFFSPVPYVEDPTPSPHQFTFHVPEGFNYLMPGMSTSREDENGLESFDVTPSMPFHMFRYWGYASGFDTTDVVSDMGMTLNLINADWIDKRNYDCYVPRDTYDSSTVGAFNFLAGRLGGPPGVFAIDIYALDGIQMPGVMSVSQVECVTDGYIAAVGGIHAYAGTAAGHQWFGPAMQPLSEREDWMKEALPTYMGMLYIQDELGGGPFYSNLASRRDSLIIEADNWRDMPLASGDRASERIQKNKGVWMLHMLRILMLDLHTGSDSEFMRFMAEAVMKFNLGRFTNHDFENLAEKHYGKPLDKFFDHWLYGLGFPKYDITYSIVNRDGDFYVDGSVATEVLNPSFEMPLLVRVSTVEGGSEFYRQPIPAGESSFTLGPLQSEPMEVEFNEFYSVLCETNIERQN